MQKQREKEASKKTTGMGMASTDDKDQKGNADEKIKKPKKKKPVVEKKEDKTTIHVKPRPNMKVKKSAIEDELR